MAVKVQFEIGHNSKLRSKKTPEGFTHDWTLYVKGVNSTDISIFVEKVVFNLHESFPKPKRVRKERPYSITESGYAGFLLPIDIYFRNRDEPKRVQFMYDLDLQQTGPPKHRCEIKKFIFECPSEEFRQKLLEGGGVPVSGVISGSGGVLGGVGGGANTTPNASHGISNEEGMVSKPKLSGGGDTSSGSIKKHKSRTDESKVSTFTDLFGTPITKSGGNSVPAKHSPDGKNNTTSGNKGVTVASGGTPNTANNSINNISTVVTAKEKPNKDKASEKTATSSTTNADKIRDKSEKKEKHKQSTSPHKESRGENKKSTSSESGSAKHEKRSEEKSKKDKVREKDRERSREKGSSNASLKRPLSPKSARDIGVPSPKKATSPPSTAAIAPARPASSASGRVEESKPLAVKTEGEIVKSRDSKVKEQSTSSSSGKKSKKEKKDKDKERDKERREDHKEKHRSGDSKLKEGERHNSNSTANTNSNVAGTNGATVGGDVKDIKNINTPSSNNKKLEKDVKSETAKTKPNDKLNEKSTGPSTATATSTPTSLSGSNEKKSTTSSSNNTPIEKEKEKEKDKKSHKHKKKDKSKDKDKERDKDKEKEKEKLKEKEKDKDKEKEKDKDKEKDKEKVDGKSNEKLTVVANLSTPVPAKPSKLDVNNTTSSTGGTAAAANNLVTSNAPTSAANKKSQNKEKKSKEKSNREDKRQRDVDPESKNKHTKNSTHATATSTSTTTTSASAATAASTAALTLPAAAPANNSNLDLSDADSLHSAHDLPKTATITPTVAPALAVAPTQQSDSSSSSFPEVPSKPSNLLPPPVALPKPNNNNTAAPAAKDAKAQVSNKEHKQRNTEKNAKTSTEKPEKSEKPEKVEKEDKKRRRSSTAVNTFIEPPLKQSKREQTKATREKSKSPSLRNARGSNSSIVPEVGNAAFLPPPTNVSATSIAPSPASAAAATANANNNATLPPPLHPASPALAADAVSNVPAAISASGAANTPATAMATNNANLPTEYLSELQELHHKIMTLQDNEELQQVVELIAATGCYEITAKTFDFDLCKLDRNTVQRLQEFFATSVS